MSIRLFTSCFQVWIYFLALQILRGRGYGVPPHELDALESFYLSLNGPSWIWENATEFGVPWNFTGNPTPCTNNVTYSWQGILCKYDSTNEIYHIRSIELPQHNLVGEIPGELSQLTDLTKLVLADNFITGTIVAELGSLQSLQHLDLDNNFIAGALPHSLVNLKQLMFFNVESNHLEGSLPDFLAAIPTLAVLDLAGNDFTGTFPAAWANMTKLRILDVSANGLHGSLPAYLGSLKALIDLDVNSNKLTGSIPLELYSLPTLLVWFMFENTLTGTISSNIGQMQHLFFVNFGSNFLSGTIPASIGQLSNMLYLLLHDNALQGSLPASIGGLRKLVQIYVYENNLDGSLPPTLSQLAALQELQAHHNRFTGALDAVFNASVQTSLIAVQLEANHLTGSIPTEPFKVPALRSFSLTSNCLVGDFPEEVCACTGLRNLLLNGLHTARPCQRKILPGLTRAYTTMHNVFGRVPSCYFAMPNLLSLHLSGNELYGSLPHDLEVSRSLVDLSLSHNELRGPIPRGIQERAWISLDMSNNHLEGTLRDDFGQPFVSPLFGVVSYTNATSGSTLSLVNNRLSGPIPGVLRDMHNISVLKENVFSCATDMHDLPRHDAERGNYNCGSTEFNKPYFVWISLVCTAVAVVALARRYQEKLRPYFDVRAFMEQLTRWVNVGHSPHYQSHLKTYNHVCDICQIVCRTSFYCAALCVLGLTPLYVLLSYTCGTHTHMYAWVVSALFLEGWPAFIGLLLTYALLICLLLGYFARSLSYNHRDWRSVLTEREQEQIEKSIARRQLPKAGIWERITTYTPMVVANFTVVLTANVAFVYIVLYGSSGTLTLAQIVLPMFKLFWNKVGSRLLSRWTTYRISQLPVRFARSEYFLLQLFVALINNIGIPCLVIIFTSPACIYHMFEPQQPAHSHYTSLQCEAFSGRTCTEYQTIVHASEYDPPFTYSYQCSASFLTYYAAAFVNLCIFSGFGTPIVQFCCKPLYPMTPEGSYLRFILKRLVPKLLRPPKVNVAPGDQPMDLFRPFYDANQVLLSLLTNLAVMLTFGVMFPPLAAGMAVTILSIFYFSRVKVGIFITAAAAANSPGLIDILDKECQGVGFMPVLHRSIWALVSTAFIFYAWFLFDVLGNSEGFRGAFWVFILLPLLSVVILPAHIALRRDAYSRTTRSASPGLDAKDAKEEGEQLVDLEMATFTTSNNSSSTSSSTSSNNRGEEAIPPQDGQEAVNAMHVKQDQQPEEPRF